MATTNTSKIDNKTVVRRFIDEIVNNGNYEVADDLIAETYTRHDPGMPAEQHGPGEFVAMIQMFREVFPDVNVEIETMITEDNLVVFRATESGTHEGPFTGVEPTGNAFEMSGLVMHRVEDGKVTETWANWDTLGMFRQLGINPDQLTEQTSDEHGKQEG